QVDLGGVGALEAQGQELAEDGQAVLGLLDAAAALEELGAVARRVAHAVAELGRLFGGGGAAGELATLIDGGGGLVEGERLGGPVPAREVVAGAEEAGGAGRRLRLERGRLLLGARGVDGAAGLGVKARERRRRRGGAGIEVARRLPVAHGAVGVAQ